MPAAFRLLDPFKVLLGDDGRPLAGGHFEFLDAETNDPKDTFGDRDLTVNNGPEVELDSVGRTSVEVWGSGAYRVRLYDAAGVMQAEAEWVEIPGGEGQTIPTPVDGYYLTSVGGVLQWAAVRQLPDPTGQDGKALVADGSGYAFQAFPTAPDIPEPNIVIDTVLRTLRVGTSDDPTKVKFQTKIDTAPATGNLASTKAVTWDEPFTSIWFVVPVITTAGVSSVSPPGLPSVSVTGWTPGAPSSGVTVNFRQMTDAGNQSQDRINNPVPFVLFAIGTVEVDED